MKYTASDVEKMLDWIGNLLLLLLVAEKEAKAAEDNAASRKTSGEISVALIDGHRFAK